MILNDRSATLSREAGTDSGADGPLLDPVALERLRRLGGDSLVRRMIDLFVQNGTLRCRAAREGLHGGDLGAVASAAHSLKSSAGNLGAGWLQCAAEQLEQDAERGDAAAVATRFAGFEEAFEAALARLIEERSRLDA